jgi:hypothetical protein
MLGGKMAENLSAAEALVEQIRKSFDSNTASPGETLQLAIAITLLDLAKDVRELTERSL